MLQHCNHRLEDESEEHPLVFQRLGKFHSQPSPLSTALVPGDLASAQALYIRGAQDIQAHKISRCTKLKKKSQNQFIVTRGQ